MNKKLSGQDSHTLKNKLNGIKEMINVITIKQKEFMKKGKLKFDYILIYLKFIRFNTLNLIVKKLEIILENLMLMKLKKEENKS